MANPRCLVLWLLAFSALFVPAPASAPAAAPRAPRFNFDTVPVYQHLAAVNSSDGSFPPARAAWLARTYPIVVIEHVQAQGYLYSPPPGARQWGPEPFSPPSLPFEDAAAAAAAQLKSLNSSVVVLYYINANTALPWYRLAAPLAADAHPEWRLSNASCRGAKYGFGAGGDNMAPYASFNFDLSVPELRAWFVSSFTNTTAAFPALDGIFADQNACTAAPEQWAGALETLRAMQAARADLIVGFDETGGEPSGNAGFRAAMNYALTAPTPKGTTPAKNSGAEAVRWLQANGNAGVISMAHDGAAAAGDGLYNYSLSVFLAGMHDTTPSYFAFCSVRRDAPIWEDCSDGGQPEAPAFPTWCAGQGASADFARPLGAPLGPAVATGGPRGEVARDFASGTRVTVELVGDACEIRWGDGHSTICGG